jgi:hypothetical protein
MRNDFYENYSGSYDIAQYIKNNHLEKKKIYATGTRSVSILPYFDNNIFDNYNNKRNPSFWMWSLKTNNMITDIKTIVEDKPDLIIICLKKHDQGKIPVVKPYKLISAFEGNIYTKDRIFQRDSFYLFSLEPL